MKKNDLVSELRQKGQYNLAQLNKDCKLLGIALTDADLTPEQVSLIRDHVLGTETGSDRPNPNPNTKASDLIHTRVQEIGVEISGIRQSLVDRREQWAADTATAIAQEVSPHSLRAALFRHLERAISDHAPAMVDPDFLLINAFESLPPDCDE